MDGYLIIDKPKEFTSFDVVAKVRSKIKQRQIGHAGTLDPNATGVLVLLLGKATKAEPFLHEENKTYEAVIRLGAASDTQDRWGQILSTSDKVIAEEDFRSAAKSFVGSYLQTPPMVSAKKTGGKKLYELARKGITVERKPQEVTIEKLELLDFSFPLARFLVTVSKGTYIRTLCEDIGQKLGIPALMEELRRVEQAGFSLADSYSMEEVMDAIEQNCLSSCLLPLDRPFEKYAKAVLKSDHEIYIRNGARLVPEDIEKLDGNDFSLVRVYTQAGEMLALYERAGDCWKVKRMFLT